MKNFRRKFLKLFGLSYLSAVLLPFNLLYSATKKIINPKLTEEQKKIMFNESTELPFSSSLNNEKFLRSWFNVHRNRTTFVL